MYDEESNTDSDNQEHCQQHSETAVTVQDYDDDKLYIQCFISGLKESSVKCPFDKILHSKHVRANHRFTTLICDFVKLMTEIHVLISELISEAIWGSITIGYDLIRWDGQINKKKGGGVCFYINDSVKYSMVQDRISNEHCELLSIILEKDYKKNVLYFFTDLLTVILIASMSF